ncbi:MAG TPA: HypC/HybG/HupF family hydrogenase formation chaperone, partial [Candidatus Parcubacteria bacterium]|nr:HypC/HybG/HupF family hydrogenase formation chaperone [Candidatus Parcubacteria bacterium]
KKGGQALVDFGKLRQEVNIELVKGVKKGDYLNVHAGFAIQKLKKQDARQTLKLFMDNGKSFSRTFKRNKKTC